MTKKVQRLKVAAITIPVLGLMAFGGASLASASGFGGQDLTDEQQTVLQEAHDLRDEGDFEGAKALIEESGIDVSKRAEGKKAHKGHMAEVGEAIESGDFATFEELTSKGPHAELITEDNFSRLQEAHEMRMNGDRDGAKEIMKELGFEPKEGKHRMRHSARSAK